MSSPLERAQQTAAPIAEALSLPVTIDERLIEAGNAFEGLKVGVGDGALREPKHWWKLRNPFRPSWGEPYVEIAARMLAAVEAARDTARGHEAVLVSHQLPIWTLRMHLEGRRYVHDPRRRQCGLASVTSRHLRGRPDERHLLRRAGRRDRPGRGPRRMRRLCSRLARGALAPATGCSTGSGAVDVNNGGEFRFVAGTPAGEVIPVGRARHRARVLRAPARDGGDSSPRQLYGQVVVLNFWGSWCAPCRVETPEFSEVWQDYTTAGVQFLGVDVKETDKQFATAFINRFGIAFPSLYDPRGEVALAFRGYPANAIPSTIVLDRRGGWPPCTPAASPRDLRSVIDRVLGEE